MTDSSDYQRLRSHLAFLRMTAAAEALPRLLDEATKANLSNQAFLERLLAVGSTPQTSAARRPWPDSRRCRRRSPWPTSTSPHNHLSTPN